MHEDEVQATSAKKKYEKNGKCLVLPYNIKKNVLWRKKEIETKINEVRGRLELPTFRFAIGRSKPLNYRAWLMYVGRFLELMYLI